MLLIYVTKDIIYIPSAHAESKLLAYWWKLNHTKGMFIVYCLITSEFGYVANHDYITKLYP